MGGEANESAPNSVVRELRRPGAVAKMTETAPDQLKNNDPKFRGSCVGIEPTELSEFTTQFPLCQSSLEVDGWETQDFKNKQSMDPHRDAESAKHQQQFFG